MTEIAHGDININLNQEEAMAGLASIEGEFDATMAHINHSRAHAEIGVNTDKFDAQVDKAKAKLDEISRAEARATLTAKMDGVDNAYARTKAKLLDLQRQKAEPHVGLNMKQLDADLARTELAIKRLSAQKAYVNVEVREGKQMLDYMDRQAKLSENRANILRDTEKAAQNLLDTERRAGLETANHELKVINLKKQYASLTDEAEKLAKKTAYGKEAKVKLELAQGKVLAEMAKLKAELEVMGEIPPVHVKVDTDGSFLQRAKLGLTDFLNKARGGLDELGRTRVNLGPISASLKSMLLGASALAPVITSLGGGIVSLAGVLTTGLAGAVSVAGGLFMGLIGNLGGTVLALKPAIQGFTEARAATQKYSQVVAKHGADSKQAKKAQEEMNSVLQHVSPASREAAVGLSAMGRAWRGATEKTAQRDFGAVIKNAVQTAKVLMPGFAADTNKTMDIVRSHIDSAFAHLRQPDEAKGLAQLGADANKFLGPALSGLERFGAGFLHIGETAAHIFAGPAGNAIKKWGQQFEQATQPGAKLDAEITRIGNHAKDLIAFFGSLGRLMATVLNGGANSGDRLVKSMTGAVRSWNQFLKTEKGQKDMSQFFDRSVNDVKALFSALNPLIAAFVQWSNLLAPFTTGLLHGVSFVSKLVAGFTKLTGLAGPLGALGATLGAAFAVSKIGGFVSMLIRAVGLVKELGAVGTIGKILSGGFGNLIKPTSLATAGPAIGEGAAATMEAAAPGIGETIGAAAAAAMEAGAVAAGATSAAEAAAGAGVAGAAAGGAGAAASDLLGAGAAAGSVASTAEGLATGLSAVSAGLATAGGLAIILGLHFLKSKEHLEDWKETLKSIQPALTGNEQNSERLASATHGLDEANADAASSYRQSNFQLKQLKDNLDKTKQGTQQHAEAELQYNNALRENNKLGEQWNKQKRETVEVNDKNVSGLKDNLKALKETEAIQRNNISNAKVTGNKDAQKRDEKALLELQNRRTVTAGLLNEALDRQASVNARLARSYAGLPALTASSTEALGKLARTAGQAGQAVAKAVATKYQSSADVSNVSSAARKSLGQGVSTTTVLHVVADASNAKQAIESLQRIGNITKHMDIIEHGGPAAVAMLAHIAGIHLSKKDVAILQHGGEGAIAIVGKLIGTIAGLHPKNVNVTASVHGLGELQVINGEIARVHSTTATVTVRTVKEESTIHTTGTGQIHGVTRHARGGKVDSPALLVGEENIPEYVIATNPAYRENNVQYLTEAAEEFGYTLAEAAGGKGGTPKTHAQPKPAHLQLPEYYAASAMPLGPIQEISKNLTKTVNTEKTKLNQLHESLEKANTRLKSAEAIEHRATGKSKVTAHEHTAAARKEKHDLEHGIKAIHDGHGASYKGVIYDRSLKNLENESKTAHDDLLKLENNNAAIEHWNSVVGTDQTRLSHLASVYNGKGPGHGSPGVLAEWQAVKGDREHAISELGKLLKNSRDMALRLNATNPSNELKGVIDGREGEIASNEQQGTETEEGALVASGAPSAAEYAEATARNVLPGLENAFALAQTNNIPDNPNTPENEELPTLTDDLKAAQALKGFWEQELGLAQSTGAPLETITDLANAVTSARSQAFGIERTVNEGSANQASTIYQEGVTFGTARLELYKNFGSNFASLWTQLPPSVAQQPVGFQGTPVQQTTKNVEVHNHFSTPPSDPHSWSNGLAFELEFAI